jgi:hypothetical protein
MAPQGAAHLIERPRYVRLIVWKSWAYFTQRVKQSLTWPINMDAV